MPVSIRDLSDLVLYTELKLGDEVIEINYRLGALGVDFNVWEATEGTKPGSLYEAVARVCTFIGITVPDEAGVEHPVECTAEALRESVVKHNVPPAIYHAILQRVRQEANAGKLRSSPSAGILV